MALTKGELAETRYDEIGNNKREAKEFVNSFFEEIKQIPIDGSSVKLSGIRTK